MSDYLYDYSKSIKKNRKALKNQLIKEQGLSRKEAKARATGMLGESYGQGDISFEPGSWEAVRDGHLLKVWNKQYTKTPKSGLYVRANGYDNASWDPEQVALMKLQALDSAIRLRNALYSAQGDLRPTEPVEADYSTLDEYQREVKLPYFSPNVPSNFAVGKILKDYEDSLGGHYGGYISAQDAGDGNVVYSKKAGMIYSPASEKNIPTLRGLYNYIGLDKLKELGLINDRNLWLLDKKNTYYAGDDVLYKDLADAEHSGWQAVEIGNADKDILDSENAYYALRHNYFKKDGGKMNKYLNGGKASIVGAIAQILTKKGALAQLATLYALAFVLLAGGEQQAVQILQKAASEGLDPAEVIIGVLQQASKQSSAQQQPTQAKKGAKLNFINELKQNCPEGTKAEYFKVGGKVCRKCQKLKLEAAKSQVKSQAKGGAVSTAVSEIRSQLVKAQKGANSKDFSDDEAWTSETDMVIPRGSGSPGREKPNAPKQPLRPRYTTTQGESRTLPDGTQMTPVRNQYATPYYPASVSGYMVQYPENTDLLGPKNLMLTNGNFEGAHSLMDNKNGGSRITLFRGPWQLKLYDRMYLEGWPTTPALEPTIKVGK